MNQDIMVKKYYSGSAGFSGIAVHHVGSWHNESIRRWGDFRDRD